MKRRIVTLIIGLAGAIGAFAQEDCTSYITNPSFENNGLEGWTVSNFVTQSNTSFKKGDVQLKDGKVYVEKWVSSPNAAGNASVRQIVRSLPLGKYTLTVAAQNLSQSEPEKKCTGAYIFAGKVTNRTSVYTPDKYSVDFSCTTGEVEIGFIAANATGNWLAADNFCIEKYANLDSYELIQSLNTLYANACLLQGRLMSKEATQMLNETIEAAESISATATDDYITEIATCLSIAINVAKASIEEFTTLRKNVTSAEPLLEKHMQNTVFTALQMAVNNAKAVSNETTDAEVKIITTMLATAVSEANTSIAAYASLLTAIDDAEATYSPDKNGSSALLTAIGDAKTMYDAMEADAATVTQMAETLTKTVFQFHLQNATPGTGTPVEVTMTNPYVPTGATEALMRFNSSGSNVLERGVCWSTQHDPTVLDSRTSSYWTLNGNIYHLTGLQPATVYYLRPYVINKTYEVAYGDEVKIVTHAKGNCTWSWDEAGPDAATNDRCRTAVKQTIDYFNEWTGIKGFHLSGHYVPGAGAGNGTADCSYGGYMRISQNAAYQAIGTVLHETGHGVGVGTSSRYRDTNLHNWKWYGRETNKIYSFLENKEANPYASDFCMVGDGTHAWGQSATYDWFVNGADKDKHIPLQYAGGCILLYGMFIDGLNPTTAYKNGISGYTYNFDDRKKYYIMCKDPDRGLNTALVCVKPNVLSTTTILQLKLRQCLGENPTISDEDAWYMEYDPNTGCYRFRNVYSGRYLKHSSSSISILSENGTPGATEDFQLMPDRTDVTIGTPETLTTTHGYWFTWNDLKAMEASKAFGADGTTTLSLGTFDFSDTATKQQFIILSEDEIRHIYNLPLAGDVNGDGTVDVADINAIISVICGTSTLTTADVNNDGTVDVADINAVISIICGGV